MIEAGGSGLDIAKFREEIENLGSDTGADKDADRLILHRNYDRLLY